MTENTYKTHPQYGSVEALATGTVINDKYEVFSVIGQGGVGTVYRVQQLFLGKDFALKLLDLHNLSTLTVRRFNQEARTASQLRHPNLVEVHDFGVLDEKQPYLVMDYVEGPSLAQILEKRTTLPVSYVVDVSIQIAFGLMYAHEQGVVHRDIKPGNIIVLNEGKAVTEGSVKIVDFGIAKLVQSEEGEIQGLTKTGEIFGSPMYMSPEQCKGTGIDKRSDIYSLGCVMFECLTGSPPFIAENAMSTMMKRLSEEPQTLKQASLGQEFPPLLENIVRKMLAGEPNNRYQDFSAVIGDLVRLKRNDQSVVVSSPATSTRESKQRSGLFNRELLLALITVAVSCSAMAAIDRLVIFRPAAADNETAAAADSKAATTKPDTQIDSGIFSAAAWKAGFPQPVGDQYPFVETTRTAKGTKQVLHFPVDCGDISFGSGKERQAQGDIDVPTGALVSLSLNRRASSEVNLLKNLTDVKFNSIHYKANFIVGNDHIAVLGKIKYLLYPMLDGTAITSLKPLYHSAHITGLDVNETTLVESELLNLQRLDKLKNLFFGPLNSRAGILKRLAAENKIERLFYTAQRFHKAISGCALSTADVEALFKLTNLRYLGVCACPNFNDASLRKLSLLKRLDELVIYDCGVTPASIPSLESFKGQVILTSAGWSSLQQMELSKAMPGRVTFIKPAKPDEAAGLALEFLQGGKP